MKICPNCLSEMEFIKERFPFYGDHLVCLQCDRKVTEVNNIIHEMLSHRVPFYRVWWMHIKLVYYEFFGKD